ncbi:NADH-quinone oxidoreductase subunit A [Candidatus Deianiraea vastatrix]|uniref:NADH-quinone oxidoreductase subunit n=1 Tax=Candidatus Deianiraea vastatrix TaxID=2163644 RepID=A0A5B8XCQ0_9RICK|nr:NADH-quinone oxidoreductase subunit A [Candidatus Deianiraea vastatrix]QED23092.1 NADH-quinone oxidoreductase subunit A [Candidatus Deianiraea vastatrix]
MIDYFTILIFSIIGVLFSIVLISIPFFIAKYKPQKEKLSPYECGIVPFANARHPFDIQFYLVAMLFIIFDLEIVILFPWAIGLKTYSIIGFSSAMIFMTLLTVGLIYEWKSGALDW